jgi:hypothetical protein
MESSMTGPEKDAYEVLQPFLGDELAKDILQHRRGLKCPLTGRGAKSLIKEYQATGNAVAAAEHHLNMGWRGFSADWMKSRTKTYHDPANPMPRRPGDMADFTREVMDLYYDRQSADIQTADNRGAERSMEVIAPSRRH